MTLPPGPNPDPNQPQHYGPTPANPYQQQPVSGYPVAYPYVAVMPTNTMAILALVFAFVFSPLAIVFGHMAKKQIRQTGENGDGLATAGLVLGYIFTSFYAIFCCGYALIFIGLGTAGSLN